MNRPERGPEGDSEIASIEETHNERQAVGAESETSGIGSVLGIGCVVVVVIFVIVAFAARWMFGAW